MIRGIYTAASGMMLQMAKQDVVANNIANVNTSGYKKDTALCRSFPEMLISRLGETAVNNQGIEKSVAPVVIGKLGTGAVMDKIITDHSAGNLQKTDNPTDLAITDDGSSYFVVRTPDGQERFTRDGSFKIDNQGQLTTNQGYLVMDSNNQPITIKGEFSVDKRGQVTVDNNPVAILKIVSFQDPMALEKTGGTWRSAQPYNVVNNPQIQQGYVEGSNVNPVKEMVDLISVNRAYESLQKMISAEDETLQVAIDQVGSVR